MKEIISKRALVTGASGFIGSCLVDKLVAEGWNVSTLGRQSKRYLDYQNTNINITSYLIDNDDNFEKIFDAAKPDLVFHCASLTPQYSMNLTPKDFINSNILFGSNILSAMAKNNIKNFINLGSYWEHYNNEIYNPVDFYAATKNAFSRIIKYYSNVYEMRSSTLELYDVYGAKDNRGKIIETLFNYAKTGKELNMTSGLQKLNFVYISDVVEGLLFLANMILEEEVDLNETYALRSNEVFSLKEAVEIIERISNKKIKVNWGSVEYKSRTIMTPPNVTKALPGFETKISFNEGLKIIYKSI